MYPFVESICVLNGKALNLEFHQQRLERTFMHVYNMIAPYRLDEIISLPDDLPKYKIKLRFLYDDQGFRYEYVKYKPMNIKTLRVVTDDKIDYGIKKTDRQSLDRLLAQKGKCDDILIAKKGFITDSSAANIVFFDGEEWYTPETPLLLGTCRARLIKEGKIKEVAIPVEQIPAYESFCLINAMFEGFDDPLPIRNIVIG